VGQDYRSNLARLLGLQERGLFQGNKIGLEKESLRVNTDGKMARTCHPIALGSALTHPYITTDYSEALAEFITPPLATVRQALAFLCEIQRFVYQQLDNEILWATSMPCVVEGDTSIPIAYYGESNAGKMKHIYRRGIGSRYGYSMQVIAGVHFNYSFPLDLWNHLKELDQSSLETIPYLSNRYMMLTRNLQRFGWIVPYLFGASPAVCKSFVGSRSTFLSDFDKNTYFGPYATSLRMGDIGYQNRKEAETGIKVCYDSLDAYIGSLECAISTPSPEWAKIGVKVDGEYRQLNANILQIENEYYSSVRLKQVLRKNERPTAALRKRGVQYLEVRSLDVNAFDPLGVNESQLRFLEALLIYCLVKDSPVFGEQDKKDIDKNMIDVAHEGRKPGLLLKKNNQSISLKDWASEICHELEPICEYLDRSEDNKPYSYSLEFQQQLVENPERTPSARMLTEMRTTGETFFAFAKRMSLQHEKYFRSAVIAEDRLHQFQQLAKQSIVDQKAIEESDKISYEEYMANYFSSGI